MKQMTFKIFKHCIGINRCQQHCVLFQEIFVWMCLVAFAYLERADGDSCYKTRLAVNFQAVNLDDSILKEVLAMC